MRMPRIMPPDDDEDTIPPASSWVSSRTRRVFDFTLACIALLLLSPLLAVCSVLVRLSSPGPIFFRQRRMGRNGREFELYKFRSMRVRCPRASSSHTVSNDRRITSVGALLRRFKLDELPQFWNVLKGDMSLVGPRPKLSHHEAIFMPYRPGLTGKATLAFRHEERMLLEVPSANVDHFYDSFVKPLKAALDIEYMERATFLSDVRILLCTLRSCLNCAVDPRRELHRLLATHSPEHRSALHPVLPVAARANIRTMQRFLPEMTDGFAGDLDDAA